MSMASPVHPVALRLSARRAPPHGTSDLTVRCAVPITPGAA